MIWDEIRINAKMQRGESAKVKLVKPSRRARLKGRYFLAGCTGTLLVVSLIGLVCGVLIFRVLNSFNLPEDFCTVEDDLVRELEVMGDQWADEINSIYPIYLDVATSQGSHLHLLRDEQRSGFFVAVIWVPRSLWGKAGYFYSHKGELPRLHPEDDLTQLEGNIYCYTIAYP